MTAGDHLPRITDQNLGELRSSAWAALVLARSDCGSCARYEREILELQARGELQEVFVGKLLLDLAGAAQFKRENPWIAALAALPYTLLLVDGAHADGFAASRASYLRERMARLGAARDGTVGSPTPPIAAGTAAPG